MAKEQIAKVNLYVTAGQANPAPPVGPALVNDMAPEHLRGRYNATFGLLFGLSGSLAPLIAGAFFGAGAGGWWPFGIAVGCGIGLLGALNLGRHLTAAQDGRVSTTS